MTNSFLIESLVRLKRIEGLEAVGGFECRKLWLPSWVSIKLSSSQN
jgi:hypothetical protein